MCKSMPNTLTLHIKIATMFSIMKCEGIWGSWNDRDIVRFCFDYIGAVARVSDIKTLEQIIVTHKSHSHIYPTAHKTEIWLVIYLPHPLIFPPLSLWSLHVSKHVEKKPKGQYREFLTLRQMSETPDFEKKCQISSKKKLFWHHGI